MAHGRRLRSRTRVALLAVLGTSFAASSTTGWGAPAHTQADAVSRTCDQVDGGFTPTSITIPRVVAQTRVLALGRDQHGVPRPPPLTEQGKWQVAWDKASGIRPGAHRGVVRLTAHTYPRDGSHGSALGNLLLTRLRTGAELRVSGSEGEQLCYRVVRQVRVRAENSLPGFYSSTGPSRLAILVCSGIRRGPGDWSHRTVWYAEPTPAAPNGS